MHANLNVSACVDGHVLCVTLCVSLTAPEPVVTALMASLLMAFHRELLCRSKRHTATESDGWMLA